MKALLIALTALMLLYLTGCAYVAGQEQTAENTTNFAAEAPTSLDEIQAGGDNE